MAVKIGVKMQISEGCLTWQDTYCIYIQHNNTNMILNEEFTTAWYVIQQASSLQLQMHLTVTVSPFCGTLQIGFFFLNSSRTKNISMVILIAQIVKIWWLKVEMQTVWHISTPWMEKCKNTNWNPPNVEAQNGGNLSYYFSVLLTIIFVGLRHKLKTHFINFIQNTT